MRCDLEFVRQDGDRYIHRCTRPECRREGRFRSDDPRRCKQQCGVEWTPPPFEETLKPNEKAKLESAAKQSGMLLGDAIAALTTAIGIPPCGGCEKRKAWLNNAHRWLLGLVSEQRQGGLSKPADGHDVQHD